MKNAKYVCFEIISKRFGWPGVSFELPGIIAGLSETNGHSFDKHTVLEDSYYTNKGTVNLIFSNLPEKNNYC